MDKSWLFEISWEVCNKVGGIHTVLGSKAAEAMKAFDNRYVCVGPLLDRNPGFWECNPPEDIVPTLNRLNEMGIPTKVGRWDVIGDPWAWLIGFKEAFPSHDGLLFQLWQDYGVNSMSGGWDYIEPVLFSSAAALAIKEIRDDVDEVTDVYAHFHEWMSGAGVLYLKKNAPEVCTLLTTHATMLGRAMSGSGIDIYNQLVEIEPTQEARAFGVVAKHSMESVSAREADCFTTVSDITRMEAANLLGTDPAVVTVNGFNLTGSAEMETVNKTRVTSRKQLIDLASRFLDRELNEDKTLLVATSGRYEFHNKGIDLLLDSLADLDDKLGQTGQDVTVVAFLLVSCGYAGFSDEARSRLKQSQYEMEKYAGISTHHLGDPDRDPVVKKCRERNLNNSGDKRCCVIFIPVYLDGNDGILNLEYYDALAGLDLTLFPSFYEPWGYTPMESAAYAVPTVTSDRAGFGQWVMGKHPEGHGGVHVLKRLEADYETSRAELTEFLHGFTQWSHEEHDRRKQDARSIAEEATWVNFYPNYMKAYAKARNMRTQRTSGIQRMAEAPGKEVSFSGVNTTHPRMRSFMVVTEMPQELRRLRDLANNLWWVWHRNAQELFEFMDKENWHGSGHNPVLFLDTMDNDRLNELAGDGEFLERVANVMDQFDQYMALAKEADTDGITWDNPIAYFSMEFGLHESIPIYSGGLGLLSGDHIKSASDLNLPFVGVSLLYKQGYFHQKINGKCEQVVEYIENNFAAMPITPVEDADGERVQIAVNLPGRTVYAQAWEVGVGRARLLLLDTDVVDNSPSDRNIASRLYDPSSTSRIEQEIILGIGGVRLLMHLAITPSVYHLNEGHSAFLLFERLRQLMHAEGQSLETAKEVVRGSTVFTMHTPVAAGNQRFDKSLAENYFRGYVEEMGVPWETIWNLCHIYAEEAQELNMTVLALRLSSIRNGVSKLHGDVSRRMWMDLWRGFLLGEVPVGHVTNGVHVTSWLDDRIRKTIEDSCNISVHEQLLTECDWECLEPMDNKALWETHQTLKQRLYMVIGRIVTEQWTREGAPLERLKVFLEALNPDHLTLTFARRFTAYKRPTLFFHNIERMKQIVCSEDKPVNIIFAGKAHPADTQGASYISHICDLAKQDDFIGRVIFLEGYDIRLARLLVAASDVWLNNPIRLMEASGTSGMKAALNGVPSCSILDGWWDEAYDTKNGWAIGTGQVYENQLSQDLVDSDNLYATLNLEVVPEFYERDHENIPHAWVNRMKQAMRTAFIQYGTHRMVRDYISDMYLPAKTLSEARNNNEYALARELGEWHKRIPGRFSTVTIKEVSVDGIPGDVIKLGNKIRVKAKVDKGQLEEEEVYAELVASTPDTETILDTVPMKIQHIEGNTLEFQAEYTPTISGPARYGVRVTPDHPGLSGKSEPRLVKWS